MRTHPLRVAAAAAVLALPCAPVDAGITTFGFIDGFPPTDGDDFTLDTRLGFDSPPVFSGFRVGEGTFTGARSLSIGHDPGGRARVEVDGLGSEYRLVVPGGNGGESLVVGRGGIGTLEVSGGGAVISDRPALNTVGLLPAATGRIEIAGLRSAYRHSEDLVVGDAGSGSITVRAAGEVYSTEGDGVVDIGRQAGSLGRVEVTGAGSLWQTPAAINVGPAGVGTLRVADGGLVDARDGGDGGITVFTLGSIELAGGRIASDEFTLVGRLSGDGRVSGPVNSILGGEIGAGPGEVLAFSDAVTSTGGLVNVAGTAQDRAEIRFEGGFTHRPSNFFGTITPARIAPSDGVVRFEQLFDNDGVLAATGGRVDVHGNIANAPGGAIVVGGRSVATFFDSVDPSDGTLTVGEGSAALFLRDLSLGSGGDASLSVRLDANALEAGTAGVAVQASGAASLGGGLSLGLVGSGDFEAYAPATLLSAAGGVGGVFAGVDGVLA